ncbi:hypothetical protein V2J09_010667 [Rumex salicifolius]
MIYECSGRENGHPNGSRPVFAPETPDPCKKVQDSDDSAKAIFFADMQNGEDSQVSVIDDRGTELASGSIIVESYDPDQDVNKAIEQKPRRKKHRPKVIREGKPKQTPKPRTPKPSDDANETPKQKRKYVRKNKTNLPSATPLESGSEALDCGPVPDPADESCRQALDFELEDLVNKNNLSDANRAPKQKRKYVRKSKTNTPSTTPMESGAEALDCSQIPDPADKSCRQALDFELEDLVNKKKLSDANGAPKQKRKYVRKSKTNTPSTTPMESGAEANGCKAQRPSKSCKKAIDFELEDRLKENNFSPRLADTPPAPNPAKEKDVMMEATREDNAYDFHRNEQREAQSISSHPTEATSSKCELNAAMMYPIDFPAFSPNDSTCPSATRENNLRGLKRDSSCSVNVPNMGMENLAVHYTQANYRFLGIRCTQGMYFPEIQKKRKKEKVLLPKPSHMLSTDELENIRASTILQSNPTGTDARTSKYYYSIPAPHFNIGAEANRQASAVHSHQNNVQFTDWGDIDKLSKRSKALTCVHGLDSQEGSEKYKKTSRTPAKKRVKGTQKKDVKTFDASSMDAHPKVSKAKQDTRKSRIKNGAAKFVTSSFNMIYNHSLNLNGYQHVSGNSKGPLLALPWKNTNITNVDEITEGLKQLSINRECSLVQYKEQNALVQYQAQSQQALVLYQRHGVIVPFEDTESSKSRLRAKVDIDDETNRVWNLLLENINSQGIDGTDEEKTKWWEEERKVFRGRVDSFIARMRLVQGDRRFSPWKGSVVDSVVGVFLTQNVSDHLSSSAYMSLAARYPPKSANKVRRDSEEEIGPFVEEPEICVVELDDSSYSLALNEKKVEGHGDGNSRSLHDNDFSEEKLVNSSSIESEKPCTSVDEKAIDDVTSSQHSVIFSQNSAESPSVPISGKLAGNGLSSENCSEGEGPPTNSNPCSSHCSGSFVQLLKMAENPSLRSTYSPIDKVLSNCSTVYQLQPEEEHHLHSVEEESRCSNSTRLVENLSTEATNIIAESVTEFQLHKKASKSNMGTSSPADNVSAYYVLEGEEMVFQSLKQQPVREQGDTINPLTEELVSPQMNIKLPVVSRDNVATESTCASNSVDDKLASNLPLSDHNYTSGEAQNELKQDSVKQKTAKNPKKASFDWDSLRKQAQANGSRAGQRTANTMDSLDWETIRCADVNDIADTIRERGMNNRLALRIKEFLDRLVNDHGSIDLEWLRDVPPDKAKEYLLSIKGLGLKSVECVRLLTLHHLAFPVDTNVGRIAVRLGWVPLQPLPESLQLHLLELYPILESIQKYLWPRLCKLDQRTLYELHYHMITFGKVFCTKRQPNCNACPLRGECRHFASAFASARLALPGPQDKSIMLSDNINLKHQDPQVTINALPMPLPMANLALATKSDVRSCEPIVEIPASPEQEPEDIQTLECDIEDAFSEDPNEIPTIKLNMEQFTQTLQAYVNSNKELQEGDMSKALVALAAEAASIPIPKLKNVSRLRTEHHVYELPDTHYLLSGLDKREPDDPCPYLLAIWSPGETANSAEPPEKRCNFEEPGQLCSDETCSYCNSQREANSQVVRGTLLIPCRTAMRGSFPLNGTYFQVNEVFADQDSSLNPIQVPRELLWNLPRRTVYFGTSIPTIFKGLSTEGIQHCFWRGYVCVRGFDQTTRAPRPLMARLHYSAFKSKGKGKISGK